MRCPVCHKDGYQITKGCEVQDYSGNWIVTQPGSGYCSNCQFSYKESENDSFDEQVEKYKKVYFMRRIASKENN